MTAKTVGKKYVRVELDLNDRHLLQNDKYFVLWGVFKNLHAISLIKHKGKSDMSDLNKVFENMTPHKVKNGTVAGRPSDKLLDSREHFPVFTEAQARSSITRAMQLNSVPAWYNGTLDELRYEVYQGIIAAHPTLKLKVPVHIEDVVAGLSDGEDGPQTKLSDIENPQTKVKSLVPEVKRPSISMAELIDKIIKSGAQLEGTFENSEAQKAFAGDLMEMLNSRKEQIEAAISLADRLGGEGISGEEFTNLMGYLQEEILYNMLQKESKGSLDDRRAELLARINKQK